MVTRFKQYSTSCQQSLSSILEVVPHEDFSLDITLSDHRHLCLNMQRFLESPAYQKLSHLGFFYPSNMTIDSSIGKNLMICTSTKFLIFLKK